MTKGTATLSTQPDGSEHFGLRTIQVKRQQGAMIIAMIMLMAVLMLGLAAAQSAVQGWQTTRNDADRQIAFQAAEAVLRDAEIDIEKSPDPAKSRSHIFSRRSVLGFPAPEEPACNRGDAGIYRGLCRYVAEVPVWQNVNFSENDPITESVAFGTFTGRRFQVGKGSLPSRLPRYIIELIPDSRPGEETDKPSYLFRVTAVGFGARESTQVALQSVYRKEGE